MAEESFTIIDNRSGNEVTVPIVDGTISSAALRQLDKGMWFYDPAYLSTANCDSKITFIDGAEGILRYRGYPIEQLADGSSFLEVCYLLLHGELPTQAQSDVWVDHITNHTYVHENIARFMQGFRYDAHPMGTLVSTVAGLSTFYPEAKDIDDPHNRMIQIIRLIAKMPTIAAMCYKHFIGKPFVYPDNTLSYSENFLHMMFGTPCEKYECHPALAKAMDRIFLLHADHEQNASTSTVRMAGSSGANPFACIAAGIAALWGPAHGGANEAVLSMLDEIGHEDNIEEYIAKAKDKNDPFRLMGFGHRVYKNYDPRATVMRQTCDEVLEVLGVENDPLFRLAKKLEKIALEDDYFVSKKLYPNVDFYSGIILKAMGIPEEMFTVIFATGRTVGWISHWNEMITHPYRIARPRQLYTGSDVREYAPIDERQSS